MSMSTQPGGSSLNPNSLLSVRMLLQQMEDLSSPEWPGSVRTWIEEMRTLVEEMRTLVNGRDGHLEINELMRELVEEVQTLINGRYGHLETDETVSGATKKHDKNPNHSLPKGKYREKPVRCVRPKCSPRRIIHQPR